MDPKLSSLRQAVQKNCHISDANHAGDYTLCVYLLKMREYYRWENGHSYSAQLGNEEVGAWLKERESLWDSLESEEFQSLTIENQQFAPFENEAINNILNPQGLIYSGGLGQQVKPHFFLGKLLRKEQLNGFTVLVSAQEYARDLSAPPAMALDQTIYIRRESVKRLLWEKLEEWRWNRPDNAMSRALSFYDFSQQMEDALEQMTDNEVDAMLLHEIGEIKARDCLGEAWEELLLSLPRCKAEIMLRAVRDHLADALSTLPALLENDNAASIHFYFANLNNMRKYLYPSLSSAYDSWHKNRDLTALQERVEQDTQHWRDLCINILELAENAEKPPVVEIENLIEANHR